MLEALGSVLAALILLLRIDANGGEILVIAAAWVTLRAAPKLGTRIFKRVEKLIEYIGSRKKFAILSAATCAILIRLTLLPFVPPPVPMITDEFSHLLLADTLARGRLTNPQHPMWRHFETIHVIHNPTYNSMYLPGQALFLAAGKLLFDNAWAGVLLSVALMSGSVCWMLQAWVPSNGPSRAEFWRPSDMGRSVTG